MTICLSQIDLGDEVAVHELEGNDFGVPGGGTTPLLPKSLLMVVHMASNDINRLGDSIELPLRSLCHISRPKVELLSHTFGGFVAQNFLLLHGQCLVKDLDLPGLGVFRSFLGDRSSGSGFGSSPK